MITTPTPTPTFKSESGSAPRRPATAVIMVTHNSADQVAESLTALRGWDVHVIDNASTDGTPTLITDGFPDVRLTARADNPGFAVAVNAALRAVRGADVVILVNPDCVVAPGTVEALVDYLADQPGVGVVGPRLLDAGGVTTVSAHPFESLASVVATRFGAGLLPPALRRHLGGRARRRTYAAGRDGSTAPLEVDWLSGACLAVRGDLLARTGGLDEAYFLYYEDEELCLQAHRHGVGVVLLPTVTARHVGGASSGLGATWPHLYRSMIIFFERHHPASLPALRAVLFVRAGLGLCLAGLRGVLRRPGAGARARAWWVVAGVARSFRPDPTTAPSSGPRPRRQEVTTCGS
jgi:GT2 family glycosyltransferase